MSLKLSQVIPQKEHVVIPVTLINPETMEYVFESITVFSPTVERVESFNSELKENMSNEEILLLLVDCFTDIVIDVDQKSFDNFKMYFSEVFDALSIELYRILSIVVKHGLRARAIATDMNSSYFEGLELLGIQESDDLKKIKKDLGI